MAEKDVSFVLEHLERINNKLKEKGWDELEMGEKDIYHDYGDLLNLRDLGRENRVAEEIINDAIEAAKPLLDKREGVFHLYTQVAYPKTISDKLKVKKESGLKKIGG